MNRRAHSLCEFQYYAASHKTSDDPEISSRRHCGSTVPETFGIRFECNFQPQDVAIELQRSLHV